MSEVDLDPPIVPYLIVDDAPGAIEFYKIAFEATAHIWPHPDGKKIAHAALTVNGGLLYLTDDCPGTTDVSAANPKALGGTTSWTVLAVDDADKWFDRAVAAGATVARPLTNEFYGRNGQIRDPFGHLWGILGPRAE